jgi:hypothetical protein
MKLRGGESERYAASERPQAVDFDREWRTLGSALKRGFDLLQRWKLVEQGEVGGNLVQGLRIVLLAQGLEASLGCRVQLKGQDGRHVGRGKGNGNRALTPGGQRSARLIASRDE